MAARKTYGHWRDILDHDNSKGAFLVYAEGEMLVAWYYPELERWLDYSGCSVYPTHWSQLPRKPRAMV